MIRIETTTRATTPNSTRTPSSVDQGNHPSAKSKSSFRKNRLSNARAGHGLGVFISGAAPRRTRSVHGALGAVAVLRRGNPPAAMLL
ncbi:hypothetical protein [Arenimonas sp.]|uniref:hypothetical protein n=1 Tax=Arenimonas sp. TaxID=1872635 RepID=UPI0025BA2554|nr:hypothetical protein [Arenimonas sp.]